MSTVSSTDVAGAAARREAAIADLSRTRAALRFSYGGSPRWATCFVLAVVLGAATDLLLPAAVAAAIDTAGRPGLQPAVLRLAALLLVSAAAAALADLAGPSFGADTTAKIRRQVIRRVLAIGVPGQARFPAGDLLSRLTNDATAPAVFLPIVLSTVTTIATAVGALIALALIHWLLAVVLLAGLPPAVLFIRMFMRGAADPFVRYQQLQAGIVSRLIDAHRGARTIRASGTRRREMERILDPLPELSRTGRHIWMLQRTIGWQIRLLVPVVQILVLVVAGLLLAAGEIPPGQLVAAAAYVTVALNGLEVVESLVAAPRARSGMVRVADVLGAPVAVPEPAAAHWPRRGPGQIELRDITVQAGERPILDHVNLVVQAGTSVAIVGKSGAGKTTLISLPGRLLDPDEGVVLLDGQDVRDLDLEWLRHTMAYAFERPALLGATVHGTIAYGRPAATRADVRAAAQAVEADAFIRRLPNGYDTPLEAAPFSGGEIQRLGLARAVLADAPVVVLDDATSSLDTATEVKVTESLQRLFAGRTALVVAHRASTAARADLVAWLDDGRIRRLAPHRHLWQDSAYRAAFGVAAEHAAVQVG